MQLSSLVLFGCALWLGACGDSQTREPDGGAGHEDASSDGATSDAAQCLDDCDDGLACTTDQCDPLTGMCSHEPGEEVCDSIDNDCDGAADEELPTTPWYIDRDQDRRGDSDAEAVLSCGAISGYSAYNDDCDDNNRAIRPTVTEICNTFDDDCDGMVDENVSVLHFRDVDLDGRGAGEAIAVCAGTAGFVMFNDDCDDNDPDVSPSRLETCDARDNDCDSAVDEALMCAG